MAVPKGDFHPFSRKMAAENLPQKVIDNFHYYYRQLVEGATGLIQETDIEPVESLADIQEVSSEETAAIGKDYTHKTVIIKLNGGLGTSMGMKQAKSLLTVKQSYTFLDIIVRQAQCLEARVPVIFMNSFSTSADTIKALKAYPSLFSGNLPVEFLQHKVPKVAVDGLCPINDWPDPAMEWCPPGHGDIYLAMTTGDVLEKLIREGYEYAFVSNADNLGAVFEPSILGYIVQNRLSFLMEVTDRTKADRKGGHLAKLISGRYVLREVAQCPQEDIGAFQDIDRHRYFNTNNIWIHLPTLKTVMEEKNSVLELPMIRNRKTVDPRDASSPAVYQLETAMGSAISVFENAGAIRVPRSRFAPVKHTGDLLSVRSDCYLLDEKFRIIPNPKRRSPRLLTDLDPAYYILIDAFERRFPVGPPSLLECESLTIRGDFEFGQNVVLKGNVRLQNDTKQRVIIKDKTYED